MSAKRPSKFPSFVYRQDGHELSYELKDIIAQARPNVKLAFFHQMLYDNSAQKRKGKDKKEKVD